MFIPRFMKICKVVQKLLGARRAHAHDNKQAKKMTDDVPRVLSGTNA
jgi:hypothetical protein